MNDEIKLTGYPDIDIAKLRADNEQYKGVIAAFSSELDGALEMADKWMHECDSLRAENERLRVLLGEWDKSVSVHHRQGTFMDLLRIQNSRLIERTREVLKEGKLLDKFDESKPLHPSHSEERRKRFNERARQNRPEGPIETEI